MTEYTNEQLLNELASRGVLDKKYAVLRPCGCIRPEGDISSCCMLRKYGGEDVQVLEYTSGWNIVNTLWK